jgi:hypothetical protein
MEEGMIHALCELFPNSDPDYLLQVLCAHDGSLSATVETLLGHIEPVEVIRPPSPWREQTRASGEVDDFKRDLGLMLQGSHSESTNTSERLSTRIKSKLKKWFSRKKQSPTEEKDAASTVSPSEPDEEVISFYAPEGLRKGEHPPPDT